MCYRCQLCDAIVPHKTPRRTHAEYREVPYTHYSPQVQGSTTSTRMEISRERAVCIKCCNNLENGDTDSLIKKRRIAELVLAEHRKVKPVRPSLSPTTNHRKHV